MKFFEPEDFPMTVMRCGQWEQKVNPEILADLANSKLEREGKVVYSKGEPSWRWYTTQNDIGTDTHQALLINIEPIKTSFDKTTDIVHTVLKYFDVHLYPPHLLESAIKNIKNQIERKEEQCKHLKEKVCIKRNLVSHTSWYECSCGVEVEPTTYGVK